MEEFGATITEILLIGAIATFLGLLLQHYWRNRRLYYMASKFDGPVWFPIVGNILPLIPKRHDIVKGVNEVIQNYKSPVRFWGGHHLIFVLTTPEQIEVVLTHPKCLAKHKLRTFAQPTLGEGLVIAPVEMWKRHRKLLSPSFNQRILDSFVEVFVDQSKILLQILEKYSRENKDFKEALEAFTLDAICETAMGVKVNAQTETENKVIEMAYRSVFLTIKRTTTPWIHPDFIFRMTSTYKDLKEANDYMHKYASEVINRKKEEFLEKRKMKLEKGDKISYQSKTFLDSLLEMAESGIHWSDKQVLDEVVTFIFAGSDTAAHSLGYIFILLGMHPEIQEKVRKEVFEVLGPEANPTPRDLSELKYTEMVVKESSRLFPLAGLLARSIEEDILIGDKILPAGSAAILAVKYVHMDPSVYPDPWKFDPTRFSPEENAKRHKFAYLAFSAGPRNCIGVRYAMMIMKMTLAVILRKFFITTHYKSVQEVQQDGFVIPKAGFKIYVSEIK